MRLLNKGAGNRESGIGNRELGIGNRESGIGNRELEQNLVYLITIRTVM
ncbi:MULTISPECIES: hypothetical protein [unclassified Moorena]|nr:MULTISPECIES: hypothetical protein [unclassified Moorena]NEO05557.1 hypothetical protein [Moorena sp. SIO3I8]NEO18664.1 hypothetical protein [Moorena sp. SIO4A5]NEO49164.1 hypothetical protein [Moorena sp. SIO4A3]NEP26308.1 hypothetical protein [Moorena sp. SIO3I6]